MKFRDFFSRNAPVFVVGGALVIFFIVIALFSQGKEDTNGLFPSLVKVSEEESSRLDSEDPLDARDNNEEVQRYDPLNPDLTEEEIEEYTSTIDIGTGKYNSSQSLLPGNPIDERINAESKEFLDNLYLDQNEVAARYGAVIIRYTEDGFVPKNAEVFIYQEVVWINQTEEPIELRQLKVFYPEWRNNNKVIYPNETYSFTIPDTTEGTWAYEEAGAKSYATIKVRYAQKYLDD